MTNVNAMNIALILWNCVFQESIKIIFFTFACLCTNSSCILFPLIWYSPRRKRIKIMKYLNVKSRNFNQSSQWNNRQKKNQFAFKIRFLSGISLFENTYYNIIPFFHQTYKYIWWRPSKCADKATYIISKIFPPNNRIRPPFVKQNANMPKLIVI